MSDEEADSLDEEAEMIMPFVLVEGNGGKFDDDSYVAGWTTGVIDYRLGLAAYSNMILPIQVLRTDLKAQIDLSAMRHGFVTKVEEVEEDSDWSYYHFLYPEMLEDEEDDADDI